MTHAMCFPFAIPGTEDNGSGLLVVVVRFSLLMATFDAGVGIGAQMLPTEAILFLSRPFHLGRVKMERLDDGHFSLVSGSRQVLLI